MARGYTPPTDPVLRRARASRAAPTTLPSAEWSYVSRYYALLPPRPTAPFTIEKAEAYLEAIMALIRRRPVEGDPGPPPWTRSEEKNLYRLARLWRRRAAGDDPRWLLVGSRAGRLAAPVEQALQPTADPTWTATDITEDDETKEP